MAPLPARPASPSPARRPVTGGAQASRRPPRCVHAAAAAAPPPPPPAAASSDDTDALVAALAATANLDSHELGALLAPNAPAALPADSAARPPPPPRGPGALLLSRLLTFTAAPADAAATAATVMQSLDDDDFEAAAAQGARPPSPRAPVGPRLQAALASVCASAFDRADADHTGALSRAELAALIGVNAGGSPADARRLDALLSEYGVPGPNGAVGPRHAVVTYAGFLRLLRDDANDLRAVLRYAGAAPAVVPPPRAPVTVRPGAVTLLFGGADLDAVSGAAGDALVVCAAGFTWCTPCKAFSPAYTALAAAYEGVAFFTKFYANSNDATKTLFKDRLAVKQTPSFALLRRGELAAPLVVGANAERLVAALSGALGDACPLAGAGDLERRAFLARLPGVVKK